MHHGTDFIHCDHGIHRSAKNGVVIATDKKVSSLLVDSDEYQKIQNITPTTGSSPHIMG